MDNLKGEYDKACRYLYVLNVYRIDFTLLQVHFTLLQEQNLGGGKAKKDKSKNEICKMNQIESLVVEILIIIHWSLLSSFM